MVVSYELLIISLNWLPKIFFGVVFLLAVYSYLSGRRRYKSLVIGSVTFRFFYAVLLTAGQYYVWSQSKFTQMLLNSPLDESLSSFLPPFSSTRLGYFLFYSYGRFWLNALISVGVAFIFYIFLKFLQKYRERFFKAGETELGFLSALIVGWPNFVVFGPLAFIFVILISIFRRIFLKEAYTTLGWPFILAAFFSLIWGSKLVQLLNLGVLKI